MDLQPFFISVSNCSSLPTCLPKKPAKNALMDEDLVSFLKHFSLNICYLTGGGDIPYSIRFTIGLKTCN